MTDEQIVLALAKKVMGWEPSERGDFYRPDWDALTEFGPLTDERDSAAVLDKMAADSWHFDLHNRLPPVGWTPQTPDCVPNGQWYACFSHHTGAIESIREGKHTDPDRRRAICIAALKAVGAWEE